MLLGCRLAFLCIMAKEHVSTCCDFLVNKNSSCTPLGHANSTGYQTPNKDSCCASVLDSGYRPRRQTSRALAASGTNQVVWQRKLTMHGARHVHTSAAPQTQGSRATMHTTRAVGASSCGRLEQFESLSCVCLCVRALQTTRPSALHTECGATIRTHMPHRSWRRAGRSRRCKSSSRSRSRTRRSPPR